MCTCVCTCVFVRALFYITCISLLYVYIFAIVTVRIFFSCRANDTFHIFSLLANMRLYLFFFLFFLSFFFLLARARSYLRDYCSLSQSVRDNPKHDILATRSATCMSCVIISIEQTKERLLTGKQLTTSISPRSLLSGYLGFSRLPRRYQGSSSARRANAAIPAARETFRAAERYPDERPSDEERLARMTFSLSRSWPRPTRDHVDQEHSAKNEIRQLGVPRLEIAARRVRDSLVVGLRSRARRQTDPFEEE